MSVRSVFNATTARVPKNFAKILAVSFLAGGLVTPALRAGDTTAADVSKTVQDVFTHAQGAVVKIEGVDGRDGDALAGTGFFIDPNGIIYTSYSVGGEARELVVSYGSRKYPAKRLMQDVRSGVAILQIEAKGTPFLPICKSGTVPVATPVLGIGYPMDLPLTPSLGTVASFDIKNPEGYFLVKHIRATVAVQGGEGGSPLLNLKGEVVGIVISGLGYGPGCYALPIDVAEKVRSDFVRFGKRQHGWIGISVVKSTDNSSGSNVMVSDLVDNTPAAKSGLQKGDFVVQIGDKTIAAPEDVLDASFFLTAGDTVPIKVVRDGQTITVKVQPASDEPALNAGAPSPGTGALRMQP